MVRTGSEGSCNRCRADVSLRVELWIPGTSRWLVCGQCALTMATENAANGITVVIKPFTMPRISCFVAGDGSYYPNPRHAELHQRELESSAIRFAKRVQAVVERRLAGRPAARQAA